MEQPPINKKILRQKMAIKGVFTLKALADKIKRTETSLHLAIERPSRYPILIKRMLKFLEVKELSDLTKTEQEVAHV